MTKYRVLIRAFTARRDIAPFALLSKVLERMGCEVIIASIRQFNRAIQLWKPHAIIINTVGYAKSISEIAPNSSIFYSPGEGAELDEISDGYYWSRHPEQYEALSGIFLWGQKQLDFFHKYNPDKIGNNIYVSGNPRFDLIRNFPESLKTSSNSNSVGFITRYPYFNHHEGRSVAFRVLMNIGIGEHGQDKFDEFMWYARSCVATIQSIKATLEQTEFNISIRPHPLESVEGYEELLLNMFSKYRHRIEVDRSIDVLSWIAKQRTMVTPLSSTIVDAYLLGVPLIGLDAIIGQVEGNHSDPIAEEWKQLCDFPNDVDELCKLLKGNVKPPSYNDAMEKQLAGFHESNNNGSACMDIAERIIESLEKSKYPIQPHLPRSVVQSLDTLAFKRAMKRNRLHWNMDYHTSCYPIPDYLNRIADNFFRQSTSLNKQKS